MKMTCVLSTDTTSFPDEKPSLSVRVLVDSHAIFSPLADEREHEDRGEPDTLGGIDFGSIQYPLAGDPRVILPPFLLLEPCDDPETAESSYDEQGGYRYIGQLLHELDLGERVDVIITRAALALWKELLPQSQRHLVALSAYANYQTELFQLEPQEIPDQMSVIPEEHVRIAEKANTLLDSPDDRERVAGLILLQGVLIDALPIVPLFRSLHSSDPVVQQGALSQLRRVASRLPTSRLSQIAAQASLSERIAAITLLGAAGTEDAAMDLKCITIYGDFRREHSLERIAVMQAFAQTCRSPHIDHIDFLDLFGPLQEVAETDPLLAVRSDAKSLVDDLTPLKREMTEKDA